MITQDLHTVPVSEDWEECDKFVCRVCGTPARLHPQTKFIWGCLPCNYTTASLYLYFFNAGTTQPAGTIKGVVI